MIIDALKEKLEKREKLYSTMLCHIGYTGLPAIYKAGGLDFLVMDLEHGSFYPESIGDFCQMCHKEELPVIVRVQDCEYPCISKMLSGNAIFSILVWFLNAYCGIIVTPSSTVISLREVHPIKALPPSLVIPSGR